MATCRGEEDDPQDRTGNLVIEGEVSEEAPRYSIDRRYLRQSSVLEALTTVSL
jgi:hypothetical protein